MGQKVVSNEASQKMMGEIGTYHEDSVSDVYNIPDTNINIGYWQLDSFSDNWADIWAVTLYNNFNVKIYWWCISGFQLLGIHY